MADVRCPYCHEYIPEDDFPAHEARHRKRRADGQKTDYATLPEE
jgi:sarcosine oxidase delta subunit